MNIALCDTSQQPDGPDWEWTGNFKNSASFREAEGCWFNVIDPTILLALKGQNIGASTYSFETADLCVFAGLLYEHKEVLALSVKVMQT
ncbi:hypothetical protein BDQ17DRAFT_1424163 [Cyathus striatus]|nr:hypothetical protein BDQ17DRAFT_1424163 [Cyathus striatus]